MLGGKLGRESGGGTQVPPDHHHAAPAVRNPIKDAQKTVRQNTPDMDGMASWQENQYDAELEAESSEVRCALVTEGCAR